MLAGDLLCQETGEDGNIDEEILWQVRQIGQSVKIDKAVGGRHVQLELRFANCKGGRNFCIPSNGRTKKSYSKLTSRLGEGFRATFERNVNEAETG